MSTKRDKMNDTIDGLVFTGMSKAMARTLVFLISEKDQVTSKDIGKAIDMGQSQVSIAIRNLEDRGWVEHDSLRGSGGHPINIYRMLVNLDEVYSSIEKDEKSKVRGMKDNLKRIRELWSLR